MLLSGLAYSAAGEVGKPALPVNLYVKSTLHACLAAWKHVYRVQCLGFFFPSKQPSSSTLKVLAKSCRHAKGSLRTAAVLRQVLNCNSYDVAMHAAIELQADKFICCFNGLADMALPQWLSLPDAEALIETRAAEVGHPAFQQNPSLADAILCGCLPHMKSIVVVFDIATSYIACNIKY